MPDHTSIYRNEAETYHQLISKQRDLAPVIEQIRPIAGLDIVDVGAGTGRLTAVLAPDARSIIALDASEEMLQVTAARLKAAGLANWATRAADNRKLPLEDRSADLVVAGWTICYLANTDVPNWEDNLNTMIAEMRRVLRPNGTIVILETMGTGAVAPNPPDFLKAYYAALVDRYGFNYQWIRTDYEFESHEQAVELTSFFFGEELGSFVREQRLTHVPECAGIWVLQL